MAKEYLMVDGKLVKADTKLVQVPDTENLNNLADENGAHATQSEEVANEIEELIVKNGVIDGSPKGVYASLSALQTAFPSGASGVYLTSDTGHWYYWNGSAWTDGGVYQSSEDIEQIKGDLDDLNGTVFQKNKKTIKLQNGEYTMCYLNADGTETTHASFATSSYYKVIEGDAIEYKQLRAPANNYGLIACYDRNKNYIRDKSVIGESGDWVDGSFTVPNGVRYVRFSFYKSAEATVTYTEEISELLKLDTKINEVESKIPNVGTYTKTVTNYDDFTWVRGKRLDLNANEQDYKTGLVSDYFDASKIKKIQYSLFAINQITTVIACYDINKNFIASESVQQKDVSQQSGAWILCEGTFQPSENVKYIRICRFAQFQVGEGQNIVTFYTTFEDEYNKTKLQLSQQWKNKKWVAFGTSITDTHNTLGADGTCTGKYVPYLEELSGMYCVNYGIAGGTISNGGLHGSSGNILTKIKSDAVLSDIQTADIITIEGFVNDFVGNVPRGTVHDTESTSLMGAIYQAVTYIYTVNPNATVVLLTEHTGQNTDSGNFNVDRVNEFGEYQYQYDDAIVEIARFLNVHCIDCGRKSQINQWHPSYLIDHIHHTELGGKQYAETIWEELKNIHCNSNVSIN